MVTTGDVSYGATLRPRVTIKNLEGDTLYTYNSFSGSNPINLTYADMEGAVGEAGTFNLRINDNQGAVDAADVHHVKCFLELGKTEATLQHFLIGYGDVFQTSRPVTNIKDYVITGLGSAIWASQLYIHRREASKIQDIDDPTVSPDGDFNSNKLIKRAIENRTWRPLKDTSIKDITGWLTTGISDKVNINIPVVNAPFTYLSDFCDQVCDVSGAVWFIDYSAGTEIFTLSYNADLHTGVTIKSGDLVQRLSDDAEKISYIKTAFSVTDESTAEAGVFPRLYTSTIIEQNKVASSLTNAGSTNTTFKAIAQQAVIDSDARRIDSLALILSKVGDPTSPKDRINGQIRLDNGNNSPRNGTILDEFTIPLGSIESSPRTVFINDLSLKERLLEGGQKKIWIILYQRSNEEDEDGNPDGNGNPNHGQNHTIRWHHNGVFNASPVLSLYSGTAEGGDKEHEEELDWKNTNLGPTYTYAIFSNIRKMQARTNHGAAATLRMRELYVPTDFIQSSKLASQFLSLNLSQTSKPKRTIQSFDVTVPNNYLFRPYQTVSFVDGLSGIAQDLQVKRVQYIVSSEQNDPQIGTLHANIALGGLYNRIIQGCSCDI